MDATTTAHWEDARRVEAWAGEIRVNLFRCLAVVAFYGHHLLRMYVYHTPSGPSPEYHRIVNGLVFAWVATILALHRALEERQVPAWLKYLVLLADTLLVTLLLMVSGGPRSPLCVLYFLIVAASALRLSLRFVWSATIGCLLGYLLVVGHTIRTQPELRISHRDQVIYMLALGGVGVLAGQSVRQARRLIRGSDVVVESP
jgi:hypothetical protein